MLEENLTPLFDSKNYSTTGGLGKKLYTSKITYTTTQKSNVGP